MSEASLSNTLIRILRRESVDHPLMTEAVEAQADLLGSEPIDVRGII
jgi:hypothetical protein